MSRADVTRSGERDVLREWITTIPAPLTARTHREIGRERMELRKREFSESKPHSEIGRASCRERVS
jgi:hypothetical protein